MYILTDCEADHAGTGFKFGDGVTVYMKGGGANYCRVGIDLSSNHDAKFVNVNLKHNSIGVNVREQRQPHNKRERGKVGRNERCPCGSGKKFKKCCINKKTTTNLNSGDKVAA
ncbi:SEC-C metal-binding domain-containing protein [Vibrio sp. 506]|uniref:SEC-C metal-binding domain-containing protein n=1 Tax=Vibrio sp. 506 TaxID=3074607 RepID=UPI0029648FE0|nr:SEC-C metal-binding domain-containing protein [Vibrio sp. 506]MDW2054860.1 SEC-C metal-binding domain-containing protein [Vibrio sp. 506]